MKCGQEKTLRLDFFQRDTRLLKSDAIRIERGSIRRKHRDGLGYGIGDSTEFLSALTQRLLGSLSLLAVSIRSIPIHTPAALPPQPPHPKRNPAPPPTRTTPGPLTYPTLAPRRS